MILKGKRKFSSKSLKFSKFLLKLLILIFNKEKSCLDIESNCLLSETESIKVSEELESKKWRSGSFELSSVTFKRIGVLIKSSLS